MYPQDKNYSLAQLIFSLGGGTLLFALSHALGLPAESSLRRHGDPISLVPSTGQPKADEMGKNIQEFLCTYKGSQKRGFQLMADETALEQRACYFPAKNELLGLCREHGKNHDLKVERWDNLETIQNAVRENQCHLGKEATVVGVAAFGFDHYNTFPLLISPTCKSENSNDCASWIQLVVTKWKTQTNLPVWSFASDGDATCRNAFHKLFMKHHVEVGTPLYLQLTSLWLFNTQCGDDDITMEFDPKHLIKRRSWSLLQAVVDTVINRLLYSVTCRERFSNL